MLMLEADRGAAHANLAKGVLAGAVGGLIGTVIMTQAQQAMMRLTSDSEDGSGDEQDDQQQNQGASSESATATVARWAAEPTLGRPLGSDEKQWGGQAVHYAMGVVSGAIYGAMAEYTPSVTSGAGTFFGAGLTGAADEVAVPALGLSAPPHEQPASTHAYALAAHLVYGMTTEAVRRGLRRAMS